jgi:hypothetical protein
MTTITTDTILNQFNIHELRLLAQKLGLDEKFGRRAAAQGMTSDIPITLMPIKMLIEKIAESIDIIIHKVSEGQTFTPAEKLDTQVVLNRFSMPLLQKLVKQLGQSGTIKVKAASKSTLIESLKPLVEFGYNFKQGHSIKKTYSAPAVEPSLESDALYMELKTQATNMRTEGNSKAEIVKSLKTMLKRTLSDVLDSNRPGVGQSATIYNLIEAKKRELFTGYAPKDRAKNATISEEDIKINTVEKQLKQWLKSYMAHIDDIVDVMQEKEDAKTGDTSELLVKRRMERAEVNKAALEKAAQKPMAPTNTEPKKRGRKPLFEKDTTMILPVTKGRPKLDPLLSESRQSEKDAKRAEKLALREEKKQIADRAAQLKEVSKARKEAEKAAKIAARS